MDGTGHRRRVVLPDCFIGALYGTERVFEMCKKRYVPVRKTFRFPNFNVPCVFFFLLKRLSTFVFFFCFLPILG